MEDIISKDIECIIKAELPWLSLANSKIVVTGAGGFIGGYIVRTLLALNKKILFNSPISIIALVRKEIKAPPWLKQAKASGELNIIEWDLCNTISPPIIDCTHVFHTASLASPKFYATSPIDVALPNSLGTISLLNMLAHSRSKSAFLFISSAEVYGEVDSNFAISEEDYGYLDPTDIRSCYAESKRFGETICTSWGHQHNLSSYIVRPFHTYGPGLKPDDGRVFADFVFNIVNNENISITSDGLARRAFCYISDAILGIFTVLFKGDINTAYNLGNPNAELSVRELAELLVSLYQEKKLTVVYKNKSENYLQSKVNKLLPNISRINRLGWQPKINPEVGFKRMIDACANMYST